MRNMANEMAVTSHLGHIAIWLLVLAGFARADAPATRPTYTNPLPVDCADPFVLHVGHDYWLYATSANDGFKTWCSPDLVHWSQKGYAFQRDDKSWGRSMFSAPCAVERNGTFYFYYTLSAPCLAARSILRICVAESRSPNGPFKDVKAPLLEIGKSTIDAETFLDDDGKAYLYYSLDNSENLVPDLVTGRPRPQSHIYVVRLGNDLISVRGTPTFCTKPDQPWEGHLINEGPLVFKHKQTYILMYSAHAFFEPSYSVGYATAKSPLGPWTKGPNNPVLSQTPQISGPGHNCVIESPDGKELFCVYHVHKNHIPGGDRQLAIDRMTVEDEPDGSVMLKVLGPTSTPQPMPSGSPATAN